MPWLRLSFMLTITSRGCIFLSPLHFGVVTLPRECTSGTDDSYVRSHMYTLPDDDDDAVTPADDEINVYLYLFLPLFISFRLSAYSCDSIHCNVRVPLGAPMCIHTSKLGVKSVTYRCNFRRTLLHCHGSAAFLARRFSEIHGDLNLSISRERAHQRDSHNATKSETRKLLKRIYVNSKHNRKVRKVSHDLTRERQSNISLIRERATRRDV